MIESTYVESELKFRMTVKYIAVFTRHANLSLLTLPDCLIPRQRQIKTKTHAANRDRTSGHSMVEM